MQRLLTLALMTLVISGCVNRGTQPDGTELTENWSFTGKMAVRNATEASSFNVDWQQRAQVFKIELSGPLGQGAVSIHGRPGDVTLRRGDDTLHAGSLQELAYEATDLNLPLDYLQFWVRARPFPGIEAQLVRGEKNGQIVSIRQSGWEVTYPDYYGEGETALPRRINFERSERSGRLVIRNWVSES